MLEGRSAGSGRCEVSGAKCEGGVEIARDAPVTLQTVLAGLPCGLGTRLTERTALKAKPMVETRGLTMSFWVDRPTFVTGGTGLVGSWLVRRLLDVGADIICLVRDWVPQSEIVQAQLIDRVKVVRGDVRDQALVERALGEYEINTVIHLAAQTIVGIANRNPVSTFERNIGGMWALSNASARNHRPPQRTSPPLFFCQQALKLWPMGII